MTFVETVWLDDAPALYIWCFSVSGTRNIPFYVGETGRHAGRRGDYRTAAWGAPTDYKVGRAIRRMLQ